MSVPIHPPIPSTDPDQDPFRPGGFQDSLRNKIMATKWWYNQLVQHFGRLDTKELEDIVKDAIMPLVPVRSGRLLDTILDTLTIELTYKTSDSLYFDLTYTHALHRPDPIRGRTKHGIVAVGEREFGLGEDYIPSHVIPNVKRMSTGTQVVNPSNYGNPGNTVLYELDDPKSRAEILETMTRLYIAAFVIEFEKMFKGIPAISGITIGKVDGYISQKEDMERFLRGGLG